MKTTLIPTFVPWTTPAVERFGCAPIATLQGSGLSYAGAPAMGSTSHLSALDGVRKDTSGVPPRGRPV